MCRKSYGKYKKSEENIFLSAVVWGAKSSAHGKKISSEQYKTIFNRIPKVMVQKGQRNSGKGKSVVI